MRGKFKKIHRMELRGCLSPFCVARMDHHILGNIKRKEVYLPHNSGGPRA